jgi:hypothetical protein
MIPNEVTGALSQQDNPRIHQFTIPASQQERPTLDGAQRHLPYGTLLHSHGHELVVV